MSEAKLFAFDENEIIVAFNARPNADKPQIVKHKLRKPTLAELIERENQIKYETVAVSSRENELDADDETANARLWDKIAISAQGYKGFDDWRELSAEEKAQMRPGHKVTAIRALYAGSCEIEGDEDSVSIGADTWTIRQNIGTDDEKPDYVVRHILREPTEAERQKFKASASRTSYVTGAKKMRIKVRTNLKPHADLYDALILNVHGGTTGPTASVDGEVYPHLLSCIDPIWKRQIIQCLMSALEAQLSD
jgi:hypothetical protein